VYAFTWRILYILIARQPALISTAFWNQLFTLVDPINLLSGFPKIVFLCIAGGIQITLIIGEELSIWLIKLITPVRRFILMVHKFEKYFQSEICHDEGTIRNPVPRMCWELAQIKNRPELSEGNSQLKRLNTTVVREINGMIYPNSRSWRSRKSSPGKICNQNIPWATWNLWFTFWGSWRKSSGGLLNFSATRPSGMNWDGDRGVQGKVDRNGFVRLAKTNQSMCKRGDGSNG